MTELLDQILALIGASARDLGEIERTLTDGYAHALSLEAEKARLERRLIEVTQGLEHGDTATKTRELTEIGRRLEGTARDLLDLRGVLSRLRLHAASVREPAAY